MDSGFLWRQSHELQHCSADMEHRARTGCLLLGQDIGGPTTAAAPVPEHPLEPATWLLHVSLGPHHGHGVPEVGKHCARQLLLHPQGDQGLESTGKGWKK